ncbi:glycoside hydrolase family 43 protein [Bacteroidota bacterium]
MKRKSSFTILLAMILAGFCQYVFADYPVASHRFLADPGAMVYNGRVYLYCSNDDDNPMDGKGDYRMTSIVCISSSDLKNWTDHGVVFEVPRDAAWAGRSWAPSPVERDDKFFLYFGNGGNGIGVAVADTPLGPFKDPIGKKLIETSTPGVLPAEHMWLFDPMAFIDDNGQAYLYFGGNGDDNVRAIKLNEDMISVDGPAVHLSALYFFEAAWMHKHNNRYYFSYSTQPRAEMRIDYMICDSPMSGFTYGGVVSLQPPENNNNNHQAIFEFHGQWYQAYHNRIVARESGIPPVYHRNLCVDQFFHNEDGTIDTMKNTVDGLKQLMYVNPFERVEAETFNQQKGIETEPCTNGSMNICSIEEGDYIRVRGVDFGKGAKKFEASLSSVSEKGEIEIRLDGPDGEKLGILIVKNTGDEQAWEIQSCKISKPIGVHDVYFIFKGPEEESFRFDWWKVS